MLALPKNRKYLAPLKLAASNHLPPTLYIPTKGLWGRGELVLSENATERPLPQSQRTQLDVWLELGYQFYESTICTMCGVSAFYGRSEHSCIEFDTEITTCYSCAAKESYSNNTELKEGESVVVTPRGPRYIGEGGETITEPLPPILEAMMKVP